MYRGAPTTPYGSRGNATPKSKQKQKQQNFSFPLLPVKDILTCLEELFFNITEAEITHCDKHVGSVRRLFEYLLEVLAGTRKDEINMPVFSAHQNLSFSQLHEESIPELAFWRAISKLMEVCGISDFTREDLMRPEPKRLKKQLSALINFAKFREERMELYQRITVERDEQLDRLADMSGENTSLQATLDELRVNTKSQREEIKALDEQIGAAAAKVDAQNEAQSSLRHTSGELKKENNALKETLGEAGLEHGRLLSEIKRLQSQVVHSPERVRREMHESQRALQLERRDGEAAEAAATVASTAAKAVVEATSKVSEATGAVGDIMDLSNKCLEVGQAIKQRETSTSANRKQAAELAERCQELERSTARLAEKLKHLEGGAEAKAHAAALQNDALRHKLLDQRRKQGARAAAVTGEQRECEQLAAAIDAEGAEHGRRMASLLGAWKRLELTVRAHQQGLTEQLQQQHPLPAPPGGAAVQPLPPTAPAPVHGVPCF